MNPDLLHITSKLEIDIAQQSEILPAIELMLKYKSGAMIVPPNLVQIAGAIRGIRQSSQKIIVAVDWKKGDLLGAAKLRTLTAAALGADGFEIQLTPGLQPNVMQAELRTLHDIIRNHISKLAEIRYVLGMFSRPESELAACCEAITKTPAPAWIRLDQHTKFKANKCNPKVITSFIDNVIRPITALPVKASGNFTSEKSIQMCMKSAARFAVTLDQYRTIVHGPPVVAAKDE